MRHGPRGLLLTLALSLLAGAAPCAGALASGYHGAFVAGNCAPVAAASDGTMVWYARNEQGLWDAYIGNGECEGEPLLPSYAGNRGPAAITPDGRYVLLTTAVGLDKRLSDSSPGEGSGNAIQLYDRRTGKLSTLLAGGSASQRGVIWPAFNADDTKIVWSQLVKTAGEDPPVGEWALHVADVNLEAGTLSDNVEWQNPDGEPAFYEAYGWIPDSDRLIFMSTSQASQSAGAFRGAQLYTLPEDLEASATTTRISPEFAPYWPGQSAVDVFHEFAHFAPGDPTTLYTSIGADTVGGDDLFSYNLESQEADGLLSQPTRISYFGGDLNANLGMQAIAGWPKPAYTVVTTMAWVDGAWVIATCPDMLCSEVNAWRIEEGAATEAPPTATPPAATPPTATSPSTPPANAGTAPSSGGSTSPASPGGAGGAGPGGAPAGGSETGVKVALPRRRLTLTGTHATVALSCTGAALCAGTLTLSAKRSGGRHARQARLEAIGAAPFSILPGASERVQLTLSAAGRRLLAASRGRLSAVLAITGAGSRLDPQLDELWSGRALLARSSRR
ncbi:MAG TPA: hypothetical protein VL979_01255 [Solirubrobacteraceae bacterium]|nr:hypothetical protein [Solirubrobacteraceae bacterium]